MILHNYYCSINHRYNTRSVYYIYVLMKYVQLESILLIAKEHQIEHCRNAGGWEGCIMAVKMKWVSDIDRTVLVSNFERLGWVRGSTEGREGKLQRVRTDIIV